MKKIFCVILLTVLLLMLGACSQSKDESVEPSNTSSTADNKEENNSVSSGSSSTDNNKYEVESQSPKSKHKSDSEKGKNQYKTTNDSDNRTKGFDIENYLNENYAIENTHYTTDTWENEDTGKTEYTVKILPNTKEFSQEMNEMFRNGHMKIYEETETMFNMGRHIMDDLSEINDKIHIDSVNWVSYDGDFHVTLIQDYD